MTKTQRARKRRITITARDAEVLALTLGEHLSRDDAAKLAGATRRTVDRWRKAGRVTSERTASGEVLIGTASLLALITLGEATS